MKVILNVHHFHELSRDPQCQISNLIWLWKTLAEHYRGQYYDTLVFELLNEPHADDGNCNGTRCGILVTDLFIKLLPVIIDAARNPDESRWLMFGGSDYNSATELKAFDLTRQRCIPFCDQSPDQGSSVLRFRDRSILPAVAAGFESEQPCTGSISG